MLTADSARAEAAHCEPEARGRKAESHSGTRVRGHVCGAHPRTPPWLTHVVAHSSGQCVGRPTLPIELRSGLFAPIACRQETLDITWMTKTWLTLVLVSLVVACASGNAATEVAAPSPPRTGDEIMATPRRQPPAEVTPPEAAKSPPIQDTSDAAPEKRRVAAMPPACDTTKDCVPPRDFAVAACNGRYPSMAIAMFEKHTPWQRLYLKAVTLEAVNAYGDRNVSVPMVFGEEVLVLRGAVQATEGRVQVSSSDIDVLRWDGTCATVARELFATTRMPTVVQAPIEWRHLEDPVQEALLKSKYVSIRYEQYRPACKSSRAESGSQCKRAADRLNEAIGVAVRDGLPLPVPEKLPVWAPERPQSAGPVALGPSQPASGTASLTRERKLHPE